MRKRGGRPVIRINGGLAAVLSLAVGFAIGAVAAASSPGVASVLLAVSEPVGTMWVNAIRMTVVPLVVALLVTGIASMRDLRAVGRLGGSALALFIALLAGVALFTALAAPPLYDRLVVDPASAAALRERAAGGAGMVPPLPGFAAWLTSLVPVNPVAAAAEGAMLPLIVFTVAFALAVSRLPDATRDVVLGVFRAVADAMLVLVRAVLWLSALGILALAITLGARLGVSGAGAIGFYLVTHAALLVAATALLYPVAVLVGGVPPGRFARAALPAQVVAMGTRSSLAALPAMLDAAEQRLQLRREVSGFALPLAVSTFRLNLAVSWIVGGLFIARLYGVPFGLSSLATFGVAAVLMSFSVPGIPSGSLFIIAPLFPTVGLPVEGVGILIALDAVPDIFKTTLNVTGHMTSAAVLARRARGDGG
ncbi:MAG TPA: cation:dicarboxylase symporter family transporter [Gemmatimonadaceae bacterium]|mgnify:CR=1 FL=1|nr:cation:dicarboxylase symporter family transporter [Gemmatimonadaceae bacterium]